MYDLVIVILNYCTADAAIEAASTVLSDMPDGAHLAIVDNASGDGSDERLSAWHQELGAPDQVSVLLSPENTGFSGGNNYAMRRVSGRRYLLLNSDTRVRPGALKALMAAADANPGAGLIAPRLTYDDGTKQHSLFRAITPIREFTRTARIGLLERLMGVPAFSAVCGEADFAPDWASFAAILLTEAAIEHVGLMDDDYFLYYEDTDYGLACRDAHLSVIACPEAEIVHFRGGSSPVKSRIASGERLPRYYLVARTRYFYKNFGRWGLLFANIAFLKGWMINIILRLFGRERSTCAFEARDIWANFGDPLRVEHKKDPKFDV